MTWKNYIIHYKTWIHYKLEENLDEYLTDLKVMEKYYHYNIKK